MYKKIEQSTVVEDIIIAPSYQETTYANFTEPNSNFAAMFHESETRYSSQIDGLYSKMSSQESKLMK